MDCIRHTQIGTRCFACAQGKDPDIVEQLMRAEPSDEQLERQAQIGKQVCAGGAVALLPSLLSPFLSGVVGLAVCAVLARRYGAATRSMLGAVWGMLTLQLVAIPALVFKTVTADGGKLTADAILQARFDETVAVVCVALMVSLSVWLARCAWQSSRELISAGRATLAGALGSCTVVAVGINIAELAFILPRLTSSPA